MAERLWRGEIAMLSRDPCRFTYISIFDSSVFSKFDLILCSVLRMPMVVLILCLVISLALLNIYH